MNIKEAKEQIEKAVSIYLAKDDYGSYRIPVEKQRPVFLIGAPGIGKTAIMEQIAEEMGIGLVSYSMTHHTRQSALGLPRIASRTYGGETFDVSLYTMSEIIAAIYETMERTGLREGILFLDEINCVSETLGPSMLQFLQYKTFGNHKVPEGWVIVTAGNPPEYNRSVRDFDVVTLDRLKVMTVEPDFGVWKYYAEQKGLHQSILTYLEIRREDFYGIETTVDGKNYVTARGWEDLSEAITLYEEKGYSVDEALVGQYIRNPHVVNEFSVYYELYRKYREDYGVMDILSGKANDALIRRAKKAVFDERVSLIGLLLEALQPRIRANVRCEKALKEILPFLRELKASCLTSEAESVETTMGGMEESWREAQRNKEMSGTTSHEDRMVYRRKMALFSGILQPLRVAGINDNAGAFAFVKEKFDDTVRSMKADTAEILSMLDHAFAFVEAAFGDGNEMLILVSGLTFNVSSAAFISGHGCESYYRYNRKFLLKERNRELYEEVNQMIGTNSLGQEEEI